MILKTFVLFINWNLSKVSLPEKAGPERTCQGSADAKAKTGPLP
jgi:hypothetical protein